MCEFVVLRAQIILNCQPTQQRVLRAIRESFQKIDVQPQTCSHLHSRIIHVAGVDRHQIVNFRQHCPIILQIRLIHINFLISHPGCQSATTFNPQLVEHSTKNSSPVIPDHSIDQILPTASQFIADALRYHERFLRCFQWHRWQIYVQYSSE